MAYPYYPATYQPMYPNVAPQTATPQNRINWVQGESGAKSYYVEPNNSVMLMDSEKDVFYIKTSDASGMPLPLRIFDYQERGKSPDRESFPAPSIDLSTYVTKEELEAFSASINNKLESLRRKDNKK